MRDPAFFSYLSKLHNAAGNLELIELNLRTSVEDKSWTTAFEDVEYVIHTASPVSLTSNSPQFEVVDPAVEGTKRVLEMCQRSSAVKKLVMTSCMCAITDEYVENRKYTEMDWNDTATATSSVYSYSKTVSESAAYAFCNADHCSFQLVSILPGTMLGPHIGGRTSLSHSMILSFLQESRAVGVPNISHAISDVRDVAVAHVAALESDKAVGRFILANNSITLLRILQIIHENFADIMVSNRTVSSTLVRFGSRSAAPDVRDWIVKRLDKPPYFSRSRSKLLGVTLRPPTETVVDTCRFFIDANIIGLNTQSSAGCVIL